MPGFPSPAARALSQLPASPKHYADGGPVGFGARGLAGLRDLVPKMAAMGYPQAAAPAPAPAASPSGADRLRAMIPQVEAMGYQQAAPAPAPPSAASRLAGGVSGPVLDYYDRVNQIPGHPRPAPAQQSATSRMAGGVPATVLSYYDRRQQIPGYADGGVVRGPGTGTSDSIEDEVPPGTFIMPADSTEAIGPSALEQLGTVPVRLSDGEFEVPPEQVMALGAAVLKLMKDATHTPVNGVDGGQTDAELAEPAGFAPDAAQRMAAPPEQRFADGGLVEPAPAAATPAAPMGWAERNAQRNASVSAASIMNRPEWSRAPAGLARRSYVDGGPVEVERRRQALVQQIPVGGQQAPAADGSQSNPLNTDLGRNAMNTLSALPGAGGLASRGGATAARATGSALSTERVIPAAWEVVQDGGALATRASAGAPAAQQIGNAAQQMGQLPGAAGPLARAATMAPQQAAPALAAPGGQIATVGAQGGQLARTGGQALQPAAGPIPGQAARGTMEFVERAPDAALGMSQGAGQAAAAGGRNLSRFATPAGAAAGAAGVGLAIDAAGGNGAMAQAPAGFAPNTPTPAAPGQVPAAAALGQMPGAAPAGITRQGNSYTGPANITGDVTINGAAPGGGAISAQNMAAADALAGRQAQESAARVLGQMPAGFQGAAVQAPTVLHSGNSWQERNDLRNALVSASSITANGGRFDRNKGESPESMAYRALLANDTAARGAAPGLAQAAMQQTGENNRAVLKEAGDTQREGIRAGALTLRAQLEARKTGQPPAGYRWSANGALEAIPGGPAAAKVAEEAKTRESAFDGSKQAIGTINRLLASPGREGATGSWNLNRFAPGTQAADFAAEVETLKAQTFLPMIQQLRGMGALSNAEGDKINAAVGALNFNMSEPAFAESLGRIRDQMGSALQRAGVDTKDVANWGLDTPSSAAAQPSIAAPAPAAASAAPPQIAELQRRAANNPALAARLKEMGY